MTTKTLSTSIAKPEYNAVRDAVQSAVESTSNTEYKWASAGPMVAAFYGSRKALENAKAAVVADMILPKLLYKGESAKGILARDTGPDARSAEGKALKESGNPLYGQYEALKKLQRNVAARMDTIFGLLRDRYAFPSTEAERAAKRTKSTKKAAQAVAAQGGGDIKKLKGAHAIRAAKAIAALMGDWQKADGLTFNVTKAMQQAKELLQTVTTETTKASK